MQPQPAQPASSIDHGRRGIAAYNAAQAAGGPGEPFGSPLHTLLPTASIRRDGGTQPRTTLNLNWVEEYGQDMLAGAVFPPAVVFFDGTDYWLADGFHRVEAADAIGLTEYPADIRQGTLRDAVLFSVGANGTHGQRRTNDDKRRAVLKLLGDPEWSAWSDHHIARQCAVDHKVVARLRPAVPIDTRAKPQADVRTFIHPKTGQPTTMRTGSINGTRSRAVQATLEAAEDHQSQAAPPLTAAGPEQLAAAPSLAEPEPEFDRAAADLHRQAMSAIVTLATVPAPGAVMEASNKHSGRGVLPDIVDRAAAWLTEFAALYAVEEPRRVQAIQELFGDAA